MAVTLDNDCDAEKISNDPLICANYPVKNCAKQQNEIRKKHRLVKFLIVEINTP